MKYKRMTEEIIEAFGGFDNLEEVGHCATRLRIYPKNVDKVNKEILNEIDQVHGVVIKNDHIQLIIGPNVSKAYSEFIEISNFRTESESQKVKVRSSSENRKFKDYVDIVGGFFAELFMPIVPALITGGVILAGNNLLINYFNISPDSGTAKIILAIFSAAFSMLPVYLGYTTARKLRLSPIMGAFLGAILVNDAISGVEGLDFLGLSVTPVEYGGSVVPVILGVIFMYYIDKILDKIIPEFGKYFLKPFLTMLVVVPTTLIILGPIGTVLSDYVGVGVVWILETLGFVSMPILSMLYPYMVMLGLDKALLPIGFQAVETIGYDPFNMVMGFISNLSIGASALAVAYSVKDKEKKGAYFSFGLTGLFGITEPAFYGALIGRPKALLGAAVGALSGGLFAGIFSLKSYVVGGAPGLFTILFFLNPDGSMGNLYISLFTAAISISASFIATVMLLKKESKKDEI